VQWPQGSDQEREVDVDFKLSAQVEAAIRFMVRDPQCQDYGVVRVDGGVAVSVHPTTYATWSQADDAAVTLWDRDGENWRPIEL
jgi:hypothetical protein